jgi:hypothetical protein
MKQFARVPEYIFCTWCWELFKENHPTLCSSAVLPFPSLSLQYFADDSKKQDERAQYRNDTY